MHTRPRGRAPAALLSLSLCAASACSGEPATGPDAGPPRLAIPLGVSLPPLTYTLALTYADQSGGADRPATIIGHLYLDVAADGQVTGAISALEYGSLGLAMISGRVVDDEMVFLDAEVKPAGNTRLELDELRIALHDKDEDGVADGASGQAAGYWLRAVNDIPDYVMHTSVLSARLDSAAPTASLYVPGDGTTLLPYEPIRVRFSEPLREADVLEHLRILIGGAPVTGELTLTSAAGVAIAATLQPDPFLAFGAEVTLQFGDLEDPSSHPLAASRERALVIADPGQVAGNTGFESDLAGWLYFGQASIEGPTEGFAPVEGVNQAVLSPGSTLAAALDVPAGATELDLSITLISYREVGGMFDDDLVEITLRIPGGEEIEIFDAVAVADRLQECPSCTLPRFFVGPLRHTFDLTPLRGQRVFLLVEARGDFILDPNPFTLLLLDDIQIR